MSKYYIPDPVEYRIDITFTDPSWELFNTTDSLSMEADSLYTVVHELSRLTLYPPMEEEELVAVAGYADVTGLHDTNYALNWALDHPEYDLVHKYTWGLWLRWVCGLTPEQAEALEVTPAKVKDYIAYLFDEVEHTVRLTQRVEI